MYAFILNKATNEVSVGLGSDTEFYKSIGMEEMEVEHAYNGQWYVKGYAPSQPLDEVKQSKISELKTIRDTEEVKPITYNGNLFDFDDKARDRINSAIIALSLQGEDASIDWTTADNADVKVTANDLRMVIATVALRSNKLHNAYRTAKEKVLEATTKEEVEKVVLNNGQ